MSKLKLDPDHLAVESFPTAASGNTVGRGTVAGHAIAAMPPTLQTCRPSDFCPTKEFNDCHTIVDEWCRCDDTKGLCESKVYCEADLSLNCTGNITRSDGN